MGGSGSALFTDPDEYQAVLPATMDLLVPRPRDFRARLTWIELPELHLLYARETVSRIAYVSLPAERAFVTFPAHRSSAIIYDGAQLRWGDVVFHSRGERLHQRTIGVIAWGALALTPASLRSYGTTLAGREIAAPPFGQILHLPSADRRRLLRLHAQAVRIAETKLGHIEHPEVARAVEQELIWALVTCLTTAEPRDGSVVRRRHAAIMVRLEAVLHARPDRSLHLSEVCEATGVSGHTLTAYCLNVLGMAPAQYFHLHRLKNTSLALLHADPATKDVSEIARQHGFAGFHQFVAAYRNAFSEFPRISRRRDEGRRV